MLKNKLIIIPLASPWNWSADYVRQTALKLAKNNQIIIYNQPKACFFLKKIERNAYPKIKNIKFIQPKYFLPGRRLAIIEKINRQLFFLLLLIKHCTKEKILWFFDPEHQYLASLKIGKTSSLYDCVDYHCGSIDENESKMIAKKEQQLIKKVDYFFVNSASLQKIHQQHRPHLLKAQGFSVPLNAPSKNQAKKGLNKKIKLGYVGGINHRLDFKLIAKLAKNNPDWQFEFIGPKQKNYLADQKLNTNYWLKKLNQLTNINFLPTQNNRKKLFEQIDAFTLAIIPYNIKLDFNRYCYPMKVFEYLYCGKKIISTPIKELKKAKFKKFIKLGQDLSAWQKIIEKAIREPLTDIEIAQSKKLALENSWENKIQMIEQKIKE